MDTNTLVSAIGWHGPPRQILAACRRGQIGLVTSEVLLSGLVRVLSYPKLKRIAGSAELPVVLAWLYRGEHLIQPRIVVRAISDDPDDNRILEAAVAASVDFVVSGDNHLLALVVYESIPIVSPAEFAAQFLSRA